jgi:chaperone modulatory protein CbpM
MMDLEGLIASITALQRADLEGWIEAELLLPHRDAATARFTDMDCARVRLICTLYYDLDIVADTLPLVLSLIDQLYDARQRFQALAAAVVQQDATVRMAILAAASGEEPQAGPAA